MAGCAPFDPAQAYVSALTSFVDCRVTNLGQDGYLALAGINSPFGIALGGLLTILIALLGYRLLLGEVLQLRDWVLAAVRVGIVLALATQWPAYQTLVYNVVIDGPEELAGAISGGGTPAAVAGRLDGDYQALADLLHPAQTSLPQSTPLNTDGAAPQISATQAPPAPRPSLTSNPRLSTAVAVLLVSGVGGLVSVRVVAGLMLALGPLFIACLLFDGLRGLFEGWVRSLGGAALGSVAVAVVLGLELAILEPQIAALVQALSVGDYTPQLVDQIFATTLLFAFATLVGLIAAARTAAGFRFPPVARIVTASAVRETEHSASRVTHSAHAVGLAPAIDQRSRASQIASAVQMLHQREQMAGAGSHTRRIEIGTMRDAPQTRAATPLGQQRRPRTAGRRTALAARRDNRQ